MQEYIRTDQQLHMLCQVLAKVAANFLNEEEDYSHTNLVFDDISNRICSRWMHNSQGAIFLALDIDQLNFQWINKSLDVIKEIDVFEHTLPELEKKVASTLTTVGFDQHQLPIELKYKIEPVPPLQFQFQQLDKSTKDLWASYRSLAKSACESLLKYINQEEDVRIWPHHFDTGLYSEIGGKLGVGFGMAPKDLHISCPYFYLSGYKLEGEELILENLPELAYGSWKDSDWKGANLPLIELEGLEYHEKIKIVNAFIKSALAWYIEKTLK